VYIEVGGLGCVCLLVGRGGGFIGPGGGGQDGAAAGAYHMSLSHAIHVVCRVYHPVLKVSILYIPSFQSRHAEMLVVCRWM
jgi:hypothetical protein